MILKQMPVNSIGFHHAALPLISSSWTIRISTWVTGIRGSWRWWGGSSSWVMSCSQACSGELMGFGEIPVWTLAVRSVITGQSLQGRNGEGGRKGLKKSSCTAYAEMQTACLSLSSYVSFLCVHQRVCSHLNIYASLFLLLRQSMTRHWCYGPAVALPLLL